MNWPEQTNEHVDDIAKKLQEAVNEQYPGKILGSVHIFMHENTDDQGERYSHSIVVQYVPEELQTDDNFLHLVHDLMDWMIKRDKGEVRP